MANEDREFKEGEDRVEGSGSSGGEVGAAGEQDGSVMLESASGAQQDGGMMLESSGAEEPSPTTEGDPPIIIQGGGNT